MRSAEFWQRVLAAELPPTKSRVLIEELGSFVADPFDLLMRSSLLSESEKRRVEATGLEGLYRAIEDGASVLEYDEYPPLLHESGNVSPALFVSGQSECLFSPTVAIVGTRSASAYGKACAYKFAQALAKSGVTVVSGGALGIDGAAHKGAIEGGGKTVAVLATGIESVYPSVHRGLFRQISSSGCLVSQFAAGSQVGDYKFLIRNVLVASLSQAIVVVEAPARSGAISTATAANDLGREVFVVPANIDLFGFQGSFNLLRDGATILTHPDQLLEALHIEPTPQVELEPLSATAEQILAILTSHPTPTERIADESGLEMSIVLSELTELELGGRIIRTAGGFAACP